MIDMYGKKNYNDKYKDQTALIVSAVVSKVTGTDLTSSKGVTTQDIFDKISSIDDLNLSNASLNKLADAISAKINSSAKSDKTSASTTTITKAELREMFDEQKKELKKIVSSDRKSYSSSEDSPAEEVKKQKSLTDTIMKSVNRVWSTTFSVLTGISKMVSNITGFIIALPFKIIGKIISGITSIITGTIKIAFKTITGIVKGIYTGISKVVTGIFNVGIKPLLTDIWGVTKRLASGIWDGLMAFVKTPAGMMALGFLSGLLYKKLIKPFWENKLRPFVDRVTEIFGEVWDGKLTIWQGIKKLIWEDPNFDVWEWFKCKLDGFFNRDVNGWIYKTFFEGSSDDGSYNWNPKQSLLFNIWGLIKHWMSKIWTMEFDLGEHETLGNYVRGITSLIDVVRNAMGSDVQGPNTNLPQIGNKVTLGQFVTATAATAAVVSAGPSGWAIAGLAWLWGRLKKYFDDWEKKLDDQEKKAFEKQRIEFNTRMKLMKDNQDPTNRILNAVTAKMDKDYLANLKILQLKTELSRAASNEQMKKNLLSPAQRHAMQMAVGETMRELVATLNSNNNKLTQEQYDKFAKRTAMYLKGNSGNILIDNQKKLLFNPITTTMAGAAEFLAIGTELGSGGNLYRQSKNLDVQSKALRDEQLKLLEAAGVNTANKTDEELDILIETVIGQLGDYQGTTGYFSKMQDDYQSTFTNETYKTVQGKILYQLEKHRQTFAADLQKAVADGKMTQVDADNQLNEFNKKADEQKLEIENQGHDIKLMLNTTTDTQKQLDNIVQILQSMDSKVTEFKKTHNVIIASNNSNSTAETVSK